MRRIPAIVAAGALLSATSAAALTFFDLTTGDEALLPDARAVAMGRTRAAEGTGAFSGATNPALLAQVGGTVAALGGSVLKLKETRSTPAYDSFDAFLVESIYALNDEYQSEGAVGVASSFVVQGVRAGAGLSFAPLRDFQYDYSEEVRDNNAFTQPRDKLLAMNEVHSEGLLNAWSLAAGASPIEPLDLGATLQLVHGRHDLFARTRFVQAGTEDLTRLDVSSLDGHRWLLGSAWRPRPAITTALVWASAWKLEGDFAREGNPANLGFVGDAASGPASGTAAMRYPQQVTLGVAWQPRAKLRTTIRVDADWAQWSAFRDDLRVGGELADVWEARLGIEHVFYNGFPLRVGIRYAPSPLDEEVATTAFTFGGGLDVGPLRADLAFEVANRRYRYPDLFDDARFGGNTRLQKDFVEENGTSAFLTVGARFAPLGG
ncbi:MAG: outer membrane protein transport protein [bacterium]